MIVDQIVGHMAAFTLATIRSFGYGGIAVLMAIESACVPVPSEVIMTFSGYLVFTHTLTLSGIVLAGTLGSLGGSLIAYAIGAYGGRPFLVRYGRYMLISATDLDQADRWFQRHGEATVLVGRLVPVLRTFISLPAGISRMALAPFVVYSFVGSLLWCLGLGWIGLLLGTEWRALGPYLHWLDRGVVVMAVIAVGLYVVRHRTAQRRRDPQ
ncbi:MAG: DedA family protein [Acidiferrobacter sp.]